MHGNRALEQHIAVFGETGSGKTVLLSSFYGATQEPQFQQDSLFDVLADDPGQATRLHQNYLGMKNARRLPVQTKFAATSYAFSVKLRESADAKASKARPFDALRLVWHDYPGEWFENSVSGPEEAARRLATFRALLSSDVALLLVDGQRLLDNAGEEERYLKSLLTNVRTGLLSLKDGLLDDGKPLVAFPRIWMIALSKSDLLPDLDVFGFRDLMVEKVGGEIEELRKVIARLVEGSEALSVGQDFVLLSSAKFDAGTIEVTERVGLDLILPIAAVLPFERHARWAKRTGIPRRVAEHLLDGVLLGGAGVRAAALIGRKVRLPGPVGLLLNHVDPDRMDEALRVAGRRLKELNTAARAKQDHLTATLTGFRMDLERAEDERVLRRSRA